MMRRPRISAAIRPYSMAVARFHSAKKEDTSLCIKPSMPRPPSARHVGRNDTPRYIEAAQALG